MGKYFILSDWSSFIWNLLIYDTQLVIGKFGREYEIDDYIFAALAIYIDIINLFSFILRLLGKASN